MGRVWPLDQVVQEREEVGWLIQLQLPNRYCVIVLEFRLIVIGFVIDFSVVFQYHHIIA